MIYKSLIFSLLRLFLAHCSLCLQLCIFNGRLYILLGRVKVLLFIFIILAYTLHFFYWRSVCVVPNTMYQSICRKRRQRVVNVYEGYYDKQYFKNLLSFSKPAEVSLANPPIFALMIIYQYPSGPQIKILTPPPKYTLHFLHWKSGGGSATP